ncbi:hypothetical protein CHS0354_013378 [Potamilus streckersoni]|uniref:Uncharacterized protein n=1 Tax=Potamilus streckersoni TaxID=2493646 RepID=A0AAE0VJX1_9BIVA|nr:hypothetical protein CHS0354_013378 [Potamilus streckersoni]
MDKWYKFTAFFLVYRMASIDCKSSTVSFSGGGSITHSATSLNLNLTFSSALAKDAYKTTYLSCDFQWILFKKQASLNGSRITLWCNGQDVPCPISCSEDEKRYTLTEISLVAIGCLLMGVILTALLFILYLKRTQQGCFSNTFKETQGDSKENPDPDLKFQTERIVVKKYDPQMPESADLTNENQYEAIQIDNTQQMYTKLKFRKPRTDHHGDESSFGRLKLDGKDEQTEPTMDSPPETERLDEYIHDRDLGGHNYFIHETKTYSQEIKDSKLGGSETYNVVGDRVKDSTMGPRDEQSDAAHEYFVLEHVEEGHNHD